MTAARKRWTKYPAVTALREDILKLLRSLGGTRACQIAEQSRKSQTIAKALSGTVE